MAFRDYSTDPDANTTIGESTYIGPNMARNLVRPALQQLAADGRELYDNFLDTTDPAPSGLARAATRTALAATPSPSSGMARLLVESGREGLFVFDASNLSAQVTADTQQGIYVAPASDTSGASGAWVRKYVGAKDARWFGAVGDGTTDDAVALQAWLDSGGMLSPPAKEFYSSAKLIIRKWVSIYGAGYTEVSDQAAGYANQPGSRIRFPAGVGGLDIQPRTTVTDVATAVAAGAGGFTQAGAFYSIIRNIALIGANTGSAVTGLRSRVTVTLDNVWVLQFKGKGIDISASSDVPDGLSEYGNANLCLIMNCVTKENGSHGLHIRGRDANVCNVINHNSQLNGGWGALDESLIGNTYTGLHVAGNTLGDIKAILGACTFVHPYVEVSGAGTELGHSNTIIGYDLYAINTDDGSPPATYASASAQTLQYAVHENVSPPTISTNIGYMYRHAGYGTVLQGKGLSGDVGLLNRAGDVAACVSPNSLDFNVFGGLYVDGNGGDTYTFADGANRFVIQNATGYKLYAATNGGAGATVGMVKDGTGYGTLSLNGNPVTLQIDAVDKVTLTATAFNLASGVSLHANGTKVIGAQGAAVADATDAASAITQLNALLARCRAHGLIAT